MSSSLVYWFVWSSASFAACTYLQQQQYRFFWSRAATVLFRLELSHRIIKAANKTAPGFLFSQSPTPPTPFFSSHECHVIFMQEKAVNKLFEMNEWGRRELIIEVTHLIILITGYSYLKYYTRHVCLNNNHNNNKKKHCQFVRRTKDLQLIPCIPIYFNSRVKSIF